MNSHFLFFTIFSVTATKQTRPSTRKKSPHKIIMNFENKKTILPNSNISSYPNKRNSI